MQRSSLLLAIILPYTSAYLQNAICAGCAGPNQFSSGYTYPSISPNPLSYFNGPTDFGNQLGKAIAASISDAYSSSYSSNPSQTKLTFGSYPQSGYSTQIYGGANDYGPQTYVIQPNDYQNANTNTYGSQTFNSYPTIQTGYDSQGYGNQGGYSYSFPNTNTFSSYVAQPSTYNLGSYGTAPTYGNTNYGTYGTNTYGTNTYGIPDPITITTGGTTNNNVGNCPYCFGNKGGYKAKRETETKKSETKRESETKKSEAKRESETKKSEAKTESETKKSNETKKN